MPNIYVFNLINFTKLGRLLATFFTTQKTFQRCLNVVVRAIWLRGVGQYRTNVETTLMYTLKFTMSNNVTLMLSTSTLIWATLETLLLFWTSNFTALIKVETTFYIWTFSKSWKEQKIIFELQKKVTHLINNFSFWLWSIEKKGIHGTYNMKINIGKYDPWYIKKY